MSGPHSWGQHFFVDEMKANDPRLVGVLKMALHRLADVAAKSSVSASVKIDAPKARAQ
jgi:hypothetical protein